MQQLREDLRESVKKQEGVVATLSNKNFIFPKKGNRSLKTMTVLPLAGQIEKLHTVDWCPFINKNYVVVVE